MTFGQIIIGPPGAGKTTYCNGMQQFLELLGRKTIVVNLDPANDILPYKCEVNIEELIKLEDVMSHYDLGPNGGLVYCMDYLEKNMDWLKDKLKPFEKDSYIIFDCPGQVELFTLHQNMKNIIQEMTAQWDYRLVAVHLVDAHLCAEAHKYVSASLLSLSTMLHLELPHVNVLSKIDLIERYGKLAFNLDYYMEVQDLSYLQSHLDQDHRMAKYRKMTSALCDVIEDFSLVNFETLNIQDKESVASLVKVIDKSNGFAFVPVKKNVKDFSKIVSEAVDWDHIRIGDVQEKYMES